MERGTSKQYLDYLFVTNRKEDKEMIEDIMREAFPSFKQRPCVDVYVLVFDSSDMLIRVQFKGHVELIFIKYYKDGTTRMSEPITSFPRGFAQTIATELAFFKGKGAGRG